MIMRYHWGLGIGHIYSHGRTAGIISVPSGAVTVAIVNGTGPEASTISAVDQLSHLGRSDHADVDDAEFSLEDREDDSFGDEEEGSRLTDLELELGTDDDEDFFAMEEMYGFDDPDSSH